MRVMVGRRIRILRLTLKVDVAAEIEIELAIAIEVSSRHASKSAGRPGGEAKRVVAQAVMRTGMDKKHRAAAPQHD